MGTEWVAPTIAGTVAVITALIAGVVAWRNVRSGAREQRAPDVTEAWAETDRARKRAYMFEDLFYTVRAALKNLVRSLTDRDPEYQMPPDVRTALEMQPPPESASADKK